jgi:cysteinyl-tRNA synthetase
VALAALFEFVRDVNNLVGAGKLSREEAQEVSRIMADFDKVLGVIGEAEKEEALPTEVVELIRRREEARKAKDWKSSDEIRAKLKTMGIIIEDTAQGAKWRKEK